ncbi:MAG: hypothetical protein A3E80_02930 [Chlamydiae bacterium RIFCSPHIGHO2_12_FULL_49_9]|nr:MAG: hypothetical protein A3E80_02930 [Chlamydiae bacterium RIFCSPHIGHO2_12_FULL_49_9]
MILDELKKQISFLDLALLAAQKRKSPRTGFCHLCYTDESATDTIPTYENFCFAFALLRQKTADAVTEGKEKLQKLLRFQTEEGNFPIYLHEYPESWDRFLPLKIAPFLAQLLKKQSSILSSEIRLSLERSLQKIMRYLEKMKDLPPLWEKRYQALLGKRWEIDTSHFTAEEWGEWLISEQLLSTEVQTEIPFHEKLQIFLGSTSKGAQEKSEPKPFPIEWALVKGEFSKRLVKDHPNQILAACFFTVQNTFDSSLAMVNEKDFKLFWPGSSLHSLYCAAPAQIGETVQIEFDLKEEPIFARNDLFEAALFCDISSETKLLINGQKGTVFDLKDTISIHTPHLTIDLKFDLLDGKGDFRGSISRSNRPGQTVLKGDLIHEAFDWQVGLRTLRRSPACVVRATLVF